MEVTMEADSQRLHVRYPVSFDVMVDAEGSPLSAHVTDISVNGLGVESLKNIPPGSQASITAQIPEDVVLYGTLLWSKHAVVNSLDTYQMGFDIHAIYYQGHVYDGEEEKDEAVEAILAKVMAGDGS